MSLCPPWIRAELIKKLQQRNKAESASFQTLIATYSKLIDNADNTKSKNVQLSYKVEKLQEENLQLRMSQGNEGGEQSSTVYKDEKMQVVEQKLFKLQEELTELHRRKGENAQHIIDLNNLMQEKERELSVKEANLLTTKFTLENTETLCKHLKSQLEELEATNQMLKDEQQALQLAYAALEDKFQRTKEENSELVERWMALKSVEADRMNVANEHVFREKQEQLKKEIAEAAKEPFVVLDDLGIPQAAFCTAVSLPNSASIKVDAHDGEVNAVSCTPSGRYVATGGGDKKIKLWEINAGRCELKGTLMGCNAGIMCIDFNVEETYLLASSNDFASRVWTMSDLRLRHTLTGHSSKVLAAKFLGGPDKVISGSHDRTLKIWDLRSKSCVRTIFAGSSCNDLVSCQGGMSIISGHFDKRIRFWDTRTEANANEILLQGRVTSLDLSPDDNCLLSCSRDDALKIIDLRMKQVMATFSADNFRTTCDWSRAKFSPDGQYVCVGSSDGSLYIWNILSRKMERHLKEITHGIVCCAWHPTGKELYTGDKQKKLVVWGDRW